MKTNQNLTFAALAAVGFTLATMSALGQTPTNMVLIPAGSFTMGNSVAADTDITDATPVSATVSEFYMDKYEVTKALWDTVRTWATANGYSFINAGSGKAANHPVQTVSWYDVVKWCNARSQKEGRTPAYYTDAALTQVYKTGQVAPYDPRGPASDFEGVGRVGRGGGWNYSAFGARCALRRRAGPDFAISHLGFRSVLAPGQP